jgi:peptidoglycan hydrolase-like protein with peptidoglycan-binding domain
MPGSLPPPRPLRGRPRHLRNHHPRHLRPRRRRPPAPLHWLVLAALAAPMLAGLASGQRTAEAAPASPAAAAVRYALGQLGKPYKWGAKGPDSYDCSGLVQRSYQAAGIRLPRVSRHQFGAGQRVPLGALQAGDLVFYAKDIHNRRTINHVGMYLGGGRMVEAPNRRAPVRIASIQRPGLVRRATRPAAGRRGLLPVQFGERSKAVAAVQHRLVANRRCLAVDGEFGPRTRRALREFQRSHGLVADGIVGPATWGALVSHGRQRSVGRC